MLALTASATPEVRADILTNLALERPLEVVRSFDRPNLWWAVASGGRPRERIRAVRRVVQATRGVAIVYAPTRRTVETVRDHLASCGHRCDAYHAGLRGPERSLVQERFMSGASRVVAATNAFGMGIDKADVRTVVHLQLPATLESYYQEAGRAGRDGAPSMCVAFHARSDRALAAGFVDRTHPRTRALRRLHGVLRRVADERGVARVDHRDVVRALGSLPREWMEGEPVGPLAALERVSAIRRLPPAIAPHSGIEPTRSERCDTSSNGTELHREGSSNGRVGVRSSADFAAAAHLRDRSLNKLRAVQRFARDRGCRRNALLRYFGESSADPCGRCDGCEWDFRAGLPDIDG